MKRISKNAGFSLVELMVVVAIIGILAAVAIPNFTKFQRRARAAEGKTMLSALYDGEKAAFASYEGYDSNFVVLGFVPEGNQLRTQAGFTTPGIHPASMAAGGINATALTSAQAVVADANANYIESYCTATTKCALAGGATPLAAPVGAGAVANPPGNETFQAGSSTDCGGGAAITDQWHINQDKLFAQNTDCTLTN